MSIGYGIHVLDRSGFVYTGRLVDTYLVPMYHMFHCGRLYWTQVLIAMMWQGEDTRSQGCTIFAYVIGVHPNNELVKSIVSLLTSLLMLLRAFDESGTLMYGILTGQ